MRVRRVGKAWNVGNKVCLDANVVALACDATKRSSARAVITANVKRLPATWFMGFALQNVRAMSLSALVSKRQSGFFM